MIGCEKKKQSQEKLTPQNIQMYNFLFYEIILKFYTDNINYYEKEEEKIQEINVFIFFLFFLNQWKIFNVFFLLNI